MEKKQRKFTFGPVFCYNKYDFSKGACFFRNKTSNMRDVSQNLFHFSVFSVWSLLIFFPLHSQPVSSSFTFHVTEISPATCYGVSDGVAEIVVTSPEKLAAIEWDFTPGPNTLRVETLSPGKHWVSLTDLKGRTYLDSIVIGASYDIQAEALVISDESLPGAKDGIAKIQVKEAQGDLSFHWDAYPGETNSILSNLEAGMYTVTVRDGRGCEATHAVSIVQMADAGADPWGIQWPENSLSDVVLFPNPSSGKVQIVLPKDAQEPTSIKVFDLSGKEVYDGASTALGPVTSLDFSHMSTGMYSVVLEYENAQVTRKLLLN